MLFELFVLRRLAREQREMRPLTTRGRILFVIVIAGLAGLTIYGLTTPGQ